MSRDKLVYHTHNVLHVIYHMELVEEQFQNLMNLFAILNAKKLIENLSTTLENHLQGRVMPLPAPTNPFGFTIKEQRTFFNH